ncbi:bile acid:sodium symporter family protein [Siphonobacter aquaeclarae]|uniref:Solute carrier family 10 (Sodium/bile acid cotransporter), member 7 n=1 Tax=Siphonobacter aquaeclarae TaxID=563176 RepID=A0A1G9NPH3_9BACT|nr:bile acid:sodium symporter family protein [Siphonobacter aquaeclarae]SDL88290.1 solute carrier family 10 (sodium/bile acid cotransporter), member 7 [Siphonobacter aquaeclarae]
MTKREWLALPARFGLDGFILALLGMIGLAWIWPEGGLGDGPFSLSTLANYGVSLIFFFYGLRLNKAKLRAGLSNWRLHLVVHASTFLLFPLLVIPLKALLQTPDTQLIWLGVFFLSTLPSTVSSSVVMVSIAEGNIPAAIFNASISSIIGVFVTPVWMQLANVEGGSGSSAHLLDVMQKLTLQVLVPVVAGILLNRYGGAYAEKNKKYLRYFDQTTILVIVYTAFCESFEKHLFASLGFGSLLVLGGGMVSLFFAAFWMITMVCNLLGFNREDRITAVFCGSKKSLIHGTVMSKVLFAGSPALGILLLPLMMYHALQLIIASILARQMAARSTLTPTPAGK